MAVYVGIDSKIPIADESVEVYQNMKRNSAFKYITYKVELPVGKVARPPPGEKLVSGVCSFSLSTLQ